MSRSSRNRSAARMFSMLVILGLALLGLACGSAPAPTTEPPSVPTSAPDEISTPTSEVALASPTEDSVPAASEDEIVIEINGGSIARYLVGEQLANRDLPNDAIGETPDVSGTIVLNADGAVQADRSKIEVNLRNLRSDEDRRDNFIKNNALESNRFPAAEFVIQNAPDLPWPLPENGEASFQLAGDMTVHGVTQPLTWDVTAQFGSGSVTGQSKASITFDQFGMEKPSLFFILSVEDEIRMELDFDASIS